MIEGIPGWLFWLAATVMVLSWTSVAMLGTGSGTVGAYRTFDVLSIPAVNRALKSRSFRFVVQSVLVFLFVFVIVAGLFGQQQAGSNIATILTWTYWWTLLVLFVMLFGKAWCYVCPWDALSGWLGRLSFWKVKTGLSANLRWPGAFRNLYPATALFLLLTWLELGYGVTTRPELTALLGILMFFLTFVPLLIFERQSFCRYGCLVGRISGLYALFSALEIRARDASVCKAACRTHDCFHGNERGYGCPTFQYLGAMTKNTYCIYCGECIKTCPHDNVAVNLRPFGQDMVKSAHVRFDEAAMVIVMLAMTSFHGLTMTPVWETSVTSIQRAAALPYLAAFTVGMFGFLILVAAAYVAFAAMSYRIAPPAGMSRRQLAIRYAYAFLPIALFYHFAHNSTHFFIEGGAIVPVLSDPFGWGWNLLGTASIRPGALLPPVAVWTISLAFIFMGQVWSLLAARRISLQISPSEPVALRSRAPVLAAMIGFSILSLWIVAQPMTMRTGL
jgi:polyferredoxin